MRERDMSLAERLALRSVSVASGCVEWAGLRNRDGYGYLRANGRRVRAHRVAWELVHGSIPPDMIICHHCDNPACVNLDHLFIGTTADNMADKTAKGRLRGQLAKGADHPAAKLTAESVRVIRERAAAGITQQALADKFGVRQDTISRLVNRRTWRHI